MKVMMIYDSVSALKLTAKVASTIADAMKAEGLDVTSVPVQDAKHVVLDDYDCLVLGCPTMAWSPTKDTKEFLRSLSGKSFSGKKAACFDTQMRSMISGNANKAMESSLQTLGYTISHPHLQAYVKGNKGEYVFLEGELERSAKWGKDLAAALKK